MTAAVAFGSPVKIKAGNTDVTVEFYTPSIVRVVKSPVGHAYTKQGLVVIANPEAVKVSQKGNTVSSDQLTVKVDPQTGAVTFISKGKTLLREKGTATFDPRTEGPDKGAYRVTQTFLLDKDEAIYGLGTFQNGKMNRRGDHKRVAEHQGLGPLLGQLLPHPVRRRSSERHVAIVRSWRLHRLLFHVWWLCRRSDCPDAPSFRRRPHVPLVDLWFLAVQGALQERK